MQPRASAVSDRFSLSGKVVVLTGGSRGLGRAMSLALAEAGASVVVASRTLAACRSVAEEITAAGGQALAHACHVGHWDELQPLLDSAYDRFGRLDVLVNNAGSSVLYDSLATVSEDLFDRTVALNLKGPFRLAVLAAERMRAERGGSIINISSLGAHRPEARALPYAAAKAGLDVVTVALAQEYGPSVRVNSIRPGSFATDVARHWDAVTTERYASRVALGRVAEPDEIVGTTLYLASDASSFTTGAVITVDGGPR
ncbi:MAG: hypothetical protein QOH56_1371 [Pseudonocardiales bacterium]|jgi:NAD(P)-dependent dehydrogenase (short-subunit alcohol dehydrogenase family)|nr:hypothetical protein [Pseudonocardiales bacterium]